MSATRPKQRGAAKGARASEVHDDNFSPNTSLNTRSSRQQEKEQLTQLNGRLATYIDRVRQLEQENSRLTVQIRDIEVVERREKNNLAERYEAEKDRLRLQIDDLAQSRAKLVIERDAAVAAHGELAARVGKLEGDLKAAEDARLVAQSLVQNLQARLNTTENKLKHVEGEKNDLDRENVRLRNQLNTVQKQLEDESLLRASAQKKLETAIEDLKFEKETHRTQLEDVRRKRQVEMTTVSKELESQYQDRLREVLEEARRDFDEQLARNRATFEQTYTNKLNEAREQAENFRDEASRARLRMTEIERSLSGSSAQVEGLHRKISALEADLDRLRNENAERLSDKDNRILELNKEIERMLIEYQDLMDTKVQLDRELRTYQTLLEGEESRLNLTVRSPNVSTTQHVSFADTATQPRGGKRRRMEDSQELDFHKYQTKAHADGPVSIVDVDENGKFIRLENTTDEEVRAVTALQKTLQVHIGGWQLKKLVGDRENSYKFNSKLAIKPKTTVTVWSSDAGKEHKPPRSLVMKNQSWVAGEESSAWLEDHDGVCTATRTTSAVHATEADTNPNDRCTVM